MATHGYGPFRRFVLGSVTSKVLHGLSCPVLTGTHVPHLDPINTEPYKRIACAIDLGPSSEKVLGWAHELSEACADDLIVIHAAPQVEVGGTYGDWFPPETVEQITKHGKEQVDALLARLGVKAEVHVSSAAPVSYACDVADKSYADLLVIGRSSHEGLLGLLQQHALGMIREAPCPVISV
jgi:nucleotide-binding universal stress UspA family protein